MSTPPQPNSELTPRPPSPSPSTTSISTYASSAPLTGNPPKDYSAAFGALASTYGSSAAMPTPVHASRKGKDGAPKPPASKSKRSLRERLFPSSSSLVTLPTSTPAADTASEPASKAPQAVPAKQGETSATLGDAAAEGNTKA